MSGITVLILYVIGATALAFKRASLKVAALTSSLLFFAYLFIGNGSWFCTGILFVSALVLCFLCVENFRKNYISKPLFSWYKSALPPISETEREAIDAGTVWWEGEIFTGNPDWDKLLSSGLPSLTEEEQAFLDGPVNELCKMVEPWNVHYSTADIPEQVVQHIKDERFLGMIIPKEYGGLDLSAVAQAKVLTRLSTCGSVVATFIGVPNSLGPGELLIKYGTEKQKDYYLPRLARGEEIPCFALTAPLAGSDATSLTDTGIVCKGKWEGKEVLGMRLNFDKRYITLAPVATLVGLAFRLQDPDHLIGDVDDYGITCALIPRDTKGLEIGLRHLPIGDPFLNGPVRGKDVFVPLDAIIGGKEMAGKGWRMLVNCLSTGRVISLPSGGNGAAKYALAATSAYARIRKQFGMPIGEFEGIQKPLARIAGLNYIIDAGLMHTAQAVAAGAKPAVPASILKYHCTEMARQVLIDAMDIHGGKAVMKGPKNYLAIPYESIPVAITVEGANIMTRNLMIFGQGAIRSHPYVLKEMELVSETDEAVAIEKFDQILFEHIGYTYNNGAKALVHALTSSVFANAPQHSPVKRYYQHLHRLSSAFVVVTDVAMLIMQSGLKRREMISARLGDLLSNLYLASMVLKEYEDQGNPVEDLPLVEWACQTLFNQYQQAMHEVLLNFPMRIAAMKMRLLVFPLGQQFNKPSDELERKIADLIIHNTPTRQRLIEGVFDSESEHHHIHALNEAMIMADEVAPLEKKLRHAVKSEVLPSLLGLELIEAGAKAGVLSEEEAKRMREYDQKIMNIIHVDEFPYDAFGRLTTTKATKPRKKKAAKKSSKVAEIVE
ncbi:MAG: acyl-CoA dehydrogenase [Gammaproteobacteria bacterium]|jgi:acyl-CoA dehydrogenase